ncbi:MAG: hypothetical protein ACLQVW_01860, partial [Limisphaerales bacterium]
MITRKTNLFDSPPTALRLRCFLALAFLAAGLGRAAATVYYVDSQAGDDARAGTAPAQAWKSLDKVNGQVFQPGDQILFKAGSRYTGQLKPQGSGKSEDNKPVLIKIGQFGDGPKPRLDGE